MTLSGLPGRSALLSGRQRLELESCGSGRALARWNCSIAGRFLWQIVYDFSPTHWNNFHSLISISKLQSSLSAALGVSSKNNFIQTFSTQPFLKILKVEVDGPSRSLSWLATNPVAYFQVGSSNRRSACYWWTAAFELKRIENYGKIS